MRPSKKVSALLQSTDPCSLEINEHNGNIDWGHNQFTAGGLSPSNLLTRWQDVGSASMAFQLVAAAIKTCQEAGLMCANTGSLKTTGYVSNVYLAQVLELLEKCKVNAGRVCA